MVETAGSSPVMFEPAERTHVSTSRHAALLAWREGAPPETRRAFSAHEDWYTSE